MAKVQKQVDKDYLVLSGSHYSGCVGYCSEVIQSKRHGIMLKLELSEATMWFNEKELKEF